MSIARHYPFTAIVGQQALKQALLLHAVDPGIGGLLVLGERGTGKSTAVRALAALLPPEDAVADCPYRCEPEHVTCTLCSDRLAAGESLPRAKVPVPVVDLPLGTTEDRLIGGIDVELALAEGRKAFAPGLLARAHRGFLYIDEVNLLDDHLVDLLLDVAASGVNVVEREGTSLRHASRFVLIGSGNPDEGDVRPQLTDRFGLALWTGTLEALDSRVQVIERRYAFERNPEAFTASWAPEEQALRERIVAARQLLPKVNPARETVECAARLGAHLGVEGHRGELCALRAATAVAAFEGATQVRPAHLRQVIVPAFAHRLPDAPARSQADGTARIEAVWDEVCVDASTRRHA